MPDDKVDEGTKGDFKIAMAHKIGTGDRLQDTIVCRLVVQLLLASLLRNKLCSLLFQNVLVRQCLGVITVGAFARDSSFLPLQGG